MKTKEKVRIHDLTATVDYSIEWHIAIDKVGNTPQNYDVRKTGGLYPKSSGTKEVEFTLVNFPSGTDWENALAYAKENNLHVTVPREVFSIGEQFPKLNKELGMDWMYAVATTECIFGGRQRACCVWWVGAGRGADLHWVSNFVDSGDWFLFRKSDLGALETPPSSVPAPLELPRCPYCKKEIRVRLEANK